MGNGLRSEFFECKENGGEYAEERYGIVPAKLFFKVENGEDPEDDEGDHSCMILG